MNELLKQLSEAVGVSGQETAVRLMIKDLIAPHVDEWQVDPMGNLIAIKKGTGAVDLKVMVDAHMDEVGLMVTAVETNGTFKFAPVGGFDDRALLGKVVQVGSKRVPGVIGCQPIHLATTSERQKIVPRSSMRIDIGSADKDGGKGKVAVGDRAAFLTPYEELGRVALGKAFDDRAGCAILIELLRQPPYPFDLVATFTVQEEVGLRGAQAAAFRVQPDVAFILDCTPAYDLPVPPHVDESPNVHLGRGPAVYVMDRSSIQDPRLVSYLLRTAAENDLCVQVRRPGGGGTNTGSIQRTAGGSAVATVSLPGRYLHAPCSMIDLDDYDHMRRLLEAALRGLTPAVLHRES